MKPFRAAPLCLALLCAASLPAAVRRVVVFKFDGVNHDVLENAMAARDPRTGRPLLPSISRVFLQDGVRLSNFFVRGISLSAPSWAELDTGRHQVIRGNVEYDRWTLHPYDYLNFFPFYLNYSEKKQVDMPGAEVLDEAGVPLLLDAFRPAERWQSFQLYQRGNQWSILEHSLPNHFKGRLPQQWFDEYVTGLQIESSVPEESERELTEALDNDNIAYLDFFAGDYDHVAHLTNSPESQLQALEGLDALVGRICAAASAARLGPETLFVLVSDHGMNTSPTVLSQGYSLVSWFNSVAGGAQHVVTDRYPLSTFKIRGLDPFVHKVTTASPDSAYLKGDADHYPTVLLDVDGNERAAVQLRSNDWNIAQILLQEANRSTTSAALKAAARAELSRWAESRSASWAHQKASLLQSLALLDASALAAETAFAASPREWTPADRQAGRDLAARRSAVLAASLRRQQTEYRDFIQAMDAFLAMPPQAKEGRVPKQSLGDENSLFDLQNYVVGLAPAGLALTPGGRLDLDRSFTRLDYFSALSAISTRNRVPPGIDPHPIDFIARRLDVSAAAAALRESNLLAAVWLSAGAAHQAIALYRDSPQGLSIRYLPISGLHAARDGSLAFQSESCAPGFPLRLCEDPRLRLPPGATAAQWLTAWHGESEWFNALQDAAYSNGLIGLSELFRPLHLASPSWASSLDPASRDCILDFETLRRTLTQPDFEVFAGDHWNFNVRSFNPGGNHGGFFRPSTHSVLMFSGGAATGVPEGLLVQRPYDSLSLAPTLLQLLGRTLPGEPLPGHVIDELHPLNAHFSPIAPP